MNIPTIAAAMSFAMICVARARRRMTVKKLLMTAALIAYASPTLARSWVTTSSCAYSLYYGYSNCQATSTYIPDPVRDVGQERRDAAERDREDAKWESSADQNSGLTNMAFAVRPMQKAAASSGEANSRLSAETSRG